MTTKTTGRNWAVKFGSIGRKVRTVGPATFGHKIRDGQLVVPSAVEVQIGLRFAARTDNKIERMRSCFLPVVISRLVKIVSLVFHNHFPLIGKNKTVVCRIEAAFDCAGCWWSAC